MTDPAPPDPGAPARAGDDADDAELRRALSGLHRMSAPQEFSRGVEQTIHDRSRGKFFGRRAFGDRVPFGLLAALALALALAVYALVRTSDTGSVEAPFDDASRAPPPAARDAIPKP